jgi:hypothetical protein
MRKSKFKNINSNRELQVVLLDLEKRWDRACSIEDPRRRYKEIIRLRGKIKMLLDESKRMKQSANSCDKDRGFVNKAFRTIVSWLSRAEKKYKDV